MGEILKNRSKKQADERLKQICLITEKLVAAMKTGTFTE